MTQGIHQLTASMVNQLNRVDVISNNLANANTVGFKEDNLAEGSFNRYLKTQIEKDEVIDKESFVMDTIPKIDSKFKDESIGALIETGNNLDFAIKDKNMFFKVQNNQGDIEYTRDGSFKVIDGELITQNGYKVLNANNGAIDINDPQFKQNIALVSTEFKNLENIGNNNYKAIDENNIVQVADNETFLLQSTLEKSNVNTIKTMVGLIEAQRKFEQSQKAITGIDTINAKVIESIGNGR
ncbi:flagellar hook-basal body protein [Arcobacter sp. 15-2]|uniref:flagellar hook-basal body protein n=1 Tax=Arcobacter sp. 15-2 TaxID=3374109 RepID=UPI00399D4D43